MNFSSGPTERLLDLIYDAAAENDLWSDALTALADLTGSQGGILFGQSFTAQKVYFDFNGRLDEACNRVYQERHMQNPWSEGMESKPVGRLVLSDELIPLAKLRSTAFYDDVLRPQGIASNAMIALAAKEGFRAAFNLCRTERQDAFGPYEQRLLEWLSPHMCRSVVMGFRIDGYIAMQRAAFSVLEQLADGVVVLDRRGRIIYANAAAQNFEADGILHLRHPLSSCTSSHSKRLGELIAAAMLGSAGGAMSIPRLADGKLLTILVSSVRSKEIGRLSDGGMKDAAVLVFVVDPAHRTSVAVSQIREAYGLTRAEARVALAASSGSTVVETARLLGLSPNTIKTHLRRVFAKTGTERQAELARLITAVGGLHIRRGDG